MAIQNRRGLEADFDPDKMLPGEWAVSTDKKFVRMCFAAGVVVKMATYEAFKTELEEYLTENPLSGLPEVAEKDNDKIMQVVGGVWDAADPVPLVTSILANMFIPLTQAEYDALVEAGTVDDSKYYMIVG